MSVGIVIPVFNQLNYTQGCLESLRKTISPDVVIVIVNNGSSDGTTAFLSTCTSATIISNPENKGCAAAWNQGVKATTADWVVILNNDVLLSSGWLEGLVAFAEQNGLDIVSPGIREGELNYDLETYAQQFVNNTGKAVRFGVANGICFMVHRRVFEKVGLFDENFRIGQFEDSDFFKRAQAAGFKLGTTGRSFIHHFGSITQNSIRESKTVRPYEAENRAYFRKKWKLNWLARRLQKLRQKAQAASWRARELRECGHSLMEKWRAGKLEHH
ncbi:glycosyltransferase family 2 protein [Pedosphaera parvula]|uniref:Glycosyl transferase family 2 n=1 Tax=Pedosphaera parvula (strain Ellin514) TaxID=320771 RepID=B9XPL6_PEDPL|nr:glycosyltransferase family 2 protein [Pedosphaera parvula]EEF58244.1 glycosyl transferase family 2 [Pedosphaera parvula Ellin514]